MWEGLHEPLRMPRRPVIATLSEGLLIPPGPWTGVSAATRLCTVLLAPRTMVGPAGLISLHTVPAARLAVMWDVWGVRLSLSGLLWLFLPGVPWGAQPSPTLPWRGGWRPVVLGLGARPAGGPGPWVLGVASAESSCLCRDVELRPQWPLGRVHSRAQPCPGGQ